MWFEITKDSKIVDIRLLKDDRDAAHYVTKYVCKGTTDEVWNDTQASQEWIIAMRGIRTAATYGTWRGFALLQPTDQTKDWQRQGSIREVVQRARHGDRWAVEVLDSLDQGIRYHPGKRTTPEPHQRE